MVTELACWVMSGPRRAVGPTRTAEGRRVDARACPRFDARACPRTLGRVAVGVWPYGLWYLAVWPLDSRRVAWPHLCTLPVPQWCPMVVSLCEDKTTYHGLLSHWGPSGLGPAAAGRSRMRRAVIVDSVEQGWDWHGPGSSGRTCPPPRSAYMIEERRRRR